MVEPPCETPRRRILANGRARDAHRVDAEMRIESAILDRDEGLRHVFRQFLDGRRDAAVAARHHHLAVDARDLDRGRAFGHFQRLDRGQMRADPGDQPDQRDDAPEREHGAPIDRAADQRAPVGLCFLAGFLRRGRRRCGFGLVASRFFGLAGRSSSAGGSRSCGSTRSSRFGPATSNFGSRRCGLSSPSHSAPRSVGRSGRPSPRIDRRRYGSGFKGRLSSANAGSVALPLCTLENT